MKLIIRFPNEVLISEGAEWVVELPPSPGAAVAVFDNDPDALAFEVEIVPE